MTTGGTHTNPIIAVLRRLTIHDDCWLQIDDELIKRRLSAEVNLFVDHSQIVHVECLRSWIWARTKDVSGRIKTFKE